MADHFVSLADRDLFVFTNTRTAQAIVHLIEDICPEIVAQIPGWNAGNPWSLANAQQAQEMVKALRLLPDLLLGVIHLLSIGGVDYED